MKKLYRKGTVHPSSPATVSEQLSFLPATIFTLIVSLSPEDKEVLAYLISCSSSSSSFYKNPNGKTKDAVEGEHHPLFHCNCFHCYMSYWIRWNSSPNHQLIHTIINDFEDFLSHTANKKKSKKNRKVSNNNLTESNSSELESLESVTASITRGSDIVDVSEEIYFVDTVEVEDEKEVKVGPVRKLINFIGEKTWCRWRVWGRRMQMVGWKGAASVVAGDGKGNLEYTGMVDAFSKTIKYEGFGALYKGLVPNSVKVS